MTAEEPLPHLYALPLGVDFATEVVAGLERRMADKPPEAWADVTILTNTPRMERRIRAALESGPARLLPRLQLITALDDPALPAPVPALRLRLDLARLVAALLDREPGIAPRESAFALADSLAALLDEMQGEGILPEALANLDVSDQSGHWARALDFVSIAQRYAGATGTAPDAEGHRRMATLALIASWATAPPQGPVIVAGSTGSRGTTALLLDAVARLPQGAVILPGFDFDTPPAIWDSLSDARAAEDHPQFRFRRLADMLGIHPSAIRPWTDAAPPAPARNRLVSLAMRPAPVTDRWIAEGPALGDLTQATAGMILVEAPSPRIEAETIALRLRRAVADGQRAALISPDRMLTRQVAAALDRWNIVPDDSAGVPLALTPPGRFLRQVAGLRGGRIGGEALVSLLKHPLCHTGADRGPHLLATHRLELRLRRQGPAYPDGPALRSLGEARDAGWFGWLADMLDAAGDPGPIPLADQVAQHLALAERLASGPDQPGAGGLWDKAAGRAARAAMEDLARHADAGGEMDATEYARLIDDLLAQGEVREPEGEHPLVRILGPREAREMEADVVILAGLNDGTWPALPAPDPWLNRAMRLRAGLLLPERQIGLSAHDYQQAIAGPEVWLTRAVKSESAETVPSRWLARLTNLLSGLPDQGGKAALDRMRHEGARWIAAAQALSVPPARVDPEPRPSPAPPVDMRPRRLSVSAIGLLLRDPYAVYAAEVLRLRRLDPLTAAADAPLRGTILHAVLEEALKAGLDPADPGAPGQLMVVAERVMARECPWPLMRRLWLARLARVADWFVAGEGQRQSIAAPALFEARGGAPVADTGVTLVAKADRIDMTPGGRAVIYDYKTGKPPSEKQQGAFDKQLLLEAALVEQGGFADLGPVAVESAAFIGLGSDPQVVPAPLGDNPPAQVWVELATLLRAWADPGRGFTARMALMTEDSASDYDHLSRFGEWDRTAEARAQVLR